MKNVTLFLGLGLGLLLMASCGSTGEKAEQKAAAPPRVQYIDQIKKMEDEMKKTTEVNNETAILAIKAYSDFVLFFPNDSLAPDYLFKAGEVATASKKYKQALTHYQNITAQYPDYKHVKEALYMQGFLLDNFINDDAAAKTVYEEFIAKYPNTPMAKDAQAAINNLGKSDEQLIQEFQKKNEKK